MPCSGCCSSSYRAALLAAGAVVAGVTATPLRAQSSHLTRLETVAPAVATDPVSVLATGGWVGAWLAPAAGHDVAGVLVGLEDGGLASVTTAFAAARVRAGLVWQVGLAQTRLADLFDDALLDQYPELGTLGASATHLGLDAVLPLGGAAVGVGIIHERDEFLGDPMRAWRLRASGAGPVILGVRAAVAVERIVSSGDAAPATGRLRIGAARPFGTGPVAFTIGAGAATGALWAAEPPRWQVASSLRVTVLDLLSVSGALGAERDPYAERGWLGFAAVAVGLTVGPIGADVRRGGIGTFDAAPLAASILYQPR